MTEENMRELASFSEAYQRMLWDRLNNQVKTFNLFRYVGKPVGWKMGSDTARAAIEEAETILGLTDTSTARAAIDEAEIIMGLREDL